MSLHYGITNFHIHSALPCLPPHLMCSIQRQEKQAQREPLKLEKHKDKLYDKFAKDEADEICAQNPDAVTHCSTSSCSLHFMWHCNDTECAFQVWEDAYNFCYDEWTNDMTADEQWMRWRCDPGRYVWTDGKPAPNVEDMQSSSSNRSWMKQYKQRLAALGMRVNEKFILEQGMFAPYL